MAGRIPVALVFNPCSGRGAHKLETEREIVRCRATNVTIANIAPPRTVVAHGPAALRPDDGHLDVTLVSVDGLADGIAAALHLYRSARASEPATRDDIGFVPVRRVVVRADPPQRVLIDGEDGGETPVAVECRPHSLRILAPPLPDVAPNRERKLDGLPELQVEPKP